MKENLKQSLKSFFGFDEFKGDQEEIIKSILSGKDTFVIMPTGGGKSMCYQLPALISEGTAIIISPLIALMKNQVDQLRSFSNNNSIAHFINSSLTKSEIEKVKKDVSSGLTKLLYVAPESLSKVENIDFLKDIKISFVAIDETHCISEWGHDFRPEYRKIRQLITQLGENITLIALTATATPKVQQDILKNLQMTDVNIFKSSFNRPNLYYEVRLKQDEIKEIIKFIKEQDGKTGIIYCLSRKKVEEIAETLNINGIKAQPYHAGLDANVRAKTQDQFLKEEVQIIVATIAFGMGIDKPDIRFVLHYDIPKSMEGYYQETGRAGRDGGEGICIAFYDKKDIDKLNKFMKDKPVSEREIGSQILKEVVEYAETAICRRKQILHYFGETFEEKDCSCMCDNCKNPKESFEGKNELLQTLNLILKLKENFHSDHIINILSGQEDAEMVTFQHYSLPEFGIGKDKGDTFWKSIVRQSVILGYLYKDIDSYGILKFTPKGLDFIKNPESVTFKTNIDFKKIAKDNEDKKQNNIAVVDETLFLMLKDLRKKLAKQKNIPTFVIFQDSSLEEMSLQYPINQTELKSISGVGSGKALKFGTPFLELIKNYVEENNIQRDQDLVFKTTVNKSSLKVSIIQNIDKKISLEDISRSKGIEMPLLIQEIESIVYSGTKLNLNYYIDEILEEDRQEEVYDYFRVAENDSIDSAIKTLGEDDYTREEIQLMRIKFISELGN